MRCWPCRPSECWWHSSECLVSAPSRSSEVHLRHSTSSPGVKRECNVVKPRNYCNRGKITCKYTCIHCYLELSTVIEAILLVLTDGPTFKGRECTNLEEQESRRKHDWSDMIARCTTQERRKMGTAGARRNAPLEKRAINVI